MKHPAKVQPAVFLVLFMGWILFAQGVPFVEVDAVGGCRLSLVGTQISDNGDGDGIADSSETLQIGIALQSACWSDSSLNSCVAWLSTESPAIDCLRRSEITVGDLPEGGPVVTPAGTFEVKIGNIDRHNLGLGPDDPLEALLIVDIRCAVGSDTMWVQEPLTLPLDLNVLDQGQTPVVWSEGFEDGGTNPADPLQGTAFHAENLDAGLPGNNNQEGLLNSDGWRCQYSDPDWHNASSYNTEWGEVCYPGINLAHANAIYWHLDGSLVAGTPDGGRAHLGGKSMYYGIFVGQTDEAFTTPAASVESVAMNDPVNLGADHPHVSFWQQVSLVDRRIISNARPMRNIDRGVMQIRLYEGTEQPISEWMTLRPVQNPYDQQAEDNFYNCMFDPVDDGNTEDDFFDPTDPDRELGPSSTCYPDYSWAFMGSTTGAFSTSDIGYASTPPADSDAPSLGQGTWIESRVDLSEFRGRRARLRFLVTGHRPGDPQVTQFGWDHDEKDDGWWIDDVVIDETLTEPATIVNDLFLLGSCSETGQPCIGQCRASLAPCSDASPCGEGDGDCLIPCPPGEVCSGPPPDCGGNCAEAQANVYVEPDGPLNPASITRTESNSDVTLDLVGSEPSWVDVCVDGHREFRVCISGDPDGDSSGLPDADCDDPWDSPVCETCPSGWSIESVVTASPDVVTIYAVEVRCSSAPDCRDSRMLEIIVECPFGVTNTQGLREIRALGRGLLTWRGPLDVDWLRGSFVSGAEIGEYVADFTSSAGYATSIPMDGDPPAGTGYYFLVKADGPANPSDFYYCGTSTWRSGGPAETLEPARNNAFGDP